MRRWGHASPASKARFLGWVRVALMIASLPLAWLSVSAWGVCMFVVVLVGLERERELERRIEELALQSARREIARREAVAVDVRARLSRALAEERKQRGEQ